MISAIRVELFGGLSVWADGAPVLDGLGKVNKPWQVFCFLVLNRNIPSSAARLIAALWTEENLTDPVNVLKNTIYALRREFKGTTDPHESPVLFENGGYICNPAIHFEVDAEIFERKAQTAAEVRDEGRLSLLSEAVDLYKGELLPQLADALWVTPLTLFYKQLYSNSVVALCEGLYAAGRYSELLAAATAASRLDALEEKYYLYIFRTLYKMEMYRAIIPAYNKMARLFSEELGISPGEEVHALYSAASERVDPVEQDIMIIKDDLREVAGDNGAVSGPLYCTYDVFKYLYQMVARSSERSGGSVMVALITLVGDSAEPPSAKVISAMMSQLKTVVLSGLLRTSDTMARYSKSQYIVMLSVDKVQSAQQIIERIHKRCEGFLAANGIKVLFATTELDHMG